MKVKDREITLKYNEMIEWSWEVLSVGLNVIWAVFVVSQLWEVYTGIRTTKI